MNNKNLIAYAVDADSGKVTWRLYDEPGISGSKNNNHYLERALNLEV